MIIKEDIEGLDFMRDFLKQHGLKSTLECLEKEENYKSIAERKKVNK